MREEEEEGEEGGGVTEGTKEEAYIRKHHLNLRTERHLLTPPITIITTAPGCSDGGKWQR
jgi:hypothetical protein